ncbi:MAG TPA: hypothetical protein VGV13_00910 [Methylomirabilota bacterium]|jgi:hypothetical protein|nr:hypothetical protein [Methylomirabilota bacterium]
MASSDIVVTIQIEPRFSFWAALKLRLAGPEIRERLLDELRLKMSQVRMQRDEF